MVDKEDMKNHETALVNVVATSRVLLFIGALTTVGMCARIWGWMAALLALGLVLMLCGVLEMFSALVYRHTERMVATLIEATDIPVVGGNIE